MSTQSPGGPRRRRIAGERRGRVLPAETPSRPAADPLDQALAERSSAPTPRPVDLGKRVPPVVVPPRASEPEPEDTTLFDDIAGPDEGADASPRRTGWWGSRMSLVLLSAVLVVLLAVVGLTALGLLGTDGLSDLDEAEATERSARTAPAAAEAAAAAILAYDHETLDADAETALNYMTDEFGADYSDTFEKVVRPAAEQNQAKVTAAVLGSSTIRSTETAATVLLFVDQTTVSRANQRPQVALNRVEMSMVREGDSWLVADISSY